MSSNKGFEEVLEDSHDEPVIKARVSAFDEASDDLERAENMGMYPQLLLCPPFLLFLSFHCTFFSLLSMLSLLPSHRHA